MITAHQSQSQLRDTPLQQCLANVVSRLVQTGFCGSTLWRPDFFGTASSPSSFFDPQERHTASVSRAHPYQRPANLLGSAVR